MKTENEIENIILLSGPIRTDKLIEKVSMKKSNKSGYSKKTLYRKISQMKKAGRISELPPENYFSHNIRDIDKRAKYLTVPKAEDRKKHLDKVISEISNAAANDLYIALHEILLYKGYYGLSPSQVDTIGEALRRNMEDDNGGEIVFMALKILHEAILEKETHPLNHLRLQVSLIKVLKNFRDVPEYRKNIRYAIRLLGYYDDHAVIEQLAYDAPKSSDDENLINEYTYPEMVGVIEHYRSDLYELEKSFVQKGDTKTAKTIHTIRKFAVDPEKYREEMKKRAGKKSKEDDDF